MQEYYFLYVIATLWIVFAVVQDLRTREVANWLNFSLIAFVLAYRAFYAIFTNEIMFFVYGLVGVLIFVILGYAFYYGKVFAGGDAKLLMGLGGVLPYQNFSDYLYIGAGFIFLLFLIGAIWTLVYSLFLVRKNKERFSKEIRKEFIRNKKLFYIAVLFVFVLIIFIIGYGVNYLFLLLLFLILLPFLYVYVKAVEKGCMIKLVHYKDLREGDWLDKNVRIGKKVILKSVHGLSKDEIKFLKKVRKKVWIKEGVPFTPSFLIAFLVLVLILRNFSL